MDRTTSTGSGTTVASLLVATVVVVAGVPAAGAAPQSVAGPTTSAVVADAGRAIPVAEATADRSTQQDCASLDVIDETRPPDGSDQQTTKNVGQEVILRGEGEPSGGEYTWEIEGDIVREYDESIRKGWKPLGEDLYGIALPPELERLGIDREGEHRKVVYFFWRDTKTDYEPFPPDDRKTVFVIYDPAPDDPSNEVCQRRVTFGIERNSDDPDRQAVDFYTDCCWLADRGVPEAPDRVTRFWEQGRLPGIEPAPRDRVLVEHYRFHAVNPTPVHSVEAGGDPVHSSHAGVEFLVHHRVLVERFNSWRTYFGYPRLGEYSGDGSTPTTDKGYDVTHDRRTTNGPDVSVPPWFTEDGDGSARPGRRSACRNDVGLLVPEGGQEDLSDFESTGALGCAIEDPWHNGVHGAVGGDMRSLTRSPKDPIFWRFHNYIAGIEQSPSLWRDWESVRSRGPPGISYTVPIRGTRVSARLSSNTADNLTSVTVTFWEPVTGVDADALTVNGSAATSVTASMDGRRYTFSGFATPDPCDLTVSLSGAGIRDADDRSFEGASWSYPVFDAHLPNGTSAAAPTDPDGDCEYEDVDGDGEVTVADAVELAFADFDAIDRLFAPDQVAALDFDGDGDVDFDDAVALAARTGTAAAVEGEP